MQRSGSNYTFAVCLLVAMLLGGLLGGFFPSQAIQLKPLGDLLLNLIFCCIVPLLFFSIAASMSRIQSLSQLKSLFANMLLVFGLSSLIAAVIALAAVLSYPPATGLAIPAPSGRFANGPSLGTQFAEIFSVPKLSLLLSTDHILALVLFSLLVGLAARMQAEEHRLFIDLLQAAERVFMRVFALILYYAPIGFFAYFAVLVAELGPQLMGNYLRIALLYTLCTLIFLAVIGTLFPILAFGRTGPRRFWSTMPLPLITALSTCSSAASIPANLIACRSMGIKPAVSDTLIPLGTMVHKDGSVMGGVFKIAFLFGIYQLPFLGLLSFTKAILVGILVGSVMGAIPSGGMLGEILIISLYGFPPQALLMVAAISLIIDPLATLVNVCSNAAAACWVNRRLEKSTAG